MQATAKMVDAHANKQSEGKILSPPTPMVIREIVAEKVALSRARLAVAGAPLLYRERQPQPANPGDPTPQWQSKANGHMAKTTVGRGEIVPVRQYRIKNPVEQHGDKLGMDKRSALERFLQDSSYAMRVSVSDPNRSGGFASPGSRLGGLGNAPQHVRDGHARHEWVIGRLNQEMLWTANALVFRELLKPDGTAFSVEDFGAQMFPSVQDRNRRWGAGAGALWALSAELVRLYQCCPIRVRRIDETERYLEQQV